MHLSSLTNTTLDNPNKLAPSDLIRNINEYLSTDTLLYFESAASSSSDSSRLLEIQEREWRPLVDWFNAVFVDARLKINRGGDDDSLIGNSSSESFNHYLKSDFTLSTLIAFNYMIECLKSVILSVALLEKRLESVDQCVRLTLLEQSHQWQNWGKVEWYHDIHEQVRLFFVTLYSLIIQIRLIKLWFKFIKIDSVSEYFKIIARVEKLRSFFWNELVYIFIFWDIKQTVF